MTLQEELEAEAKVILLLPYLCFNDKPLSGLQLVVGVGGQRKKNRPKNSTIKHSYNFISTIYENSGGVTAPLPSRCRRL